MRLKQISFKDFRQFHGMQTLHFSFESQRNVTLVFGTNGAGKTTILNAIQWVLFNKFSEDFEQHERLINDASIARAGEGRTVRGSVELHFEHGNRQFEMTRWVDSMLVDGLQVIQERGESLFVIDEFGASSKYANPSGLVSTMFPERLSGFFFFNGERLAQNVASGFSKMREEIKEVMDLVKYERALRHLPGARSLLVGELAKLTSQGETVDLGDQLKTCSSKLTEAEEMNHKLVKTRDDLREQIDEISERLRKHDSSKQLQIERDRWQEESDSASKRRLEARRAMLRLIGQRGVVAFMSEMSETTLANSEKLRVKGELPSAVKIQFIDDLLHSGSCICGTTLSEGSIAHQKVASWRRKAGRAESEEAWITVTAFARSKEREIKDFQSDLRGVSERVRTAENEEASAEARLLEITKKLREFDLVEVQDLERRRSEIQREWERVLGAFALNEREVDRLKAEIRILEAKIASIAEKSQQADLVKRRINAVDAATALIGEELRIRNQMVRRELQQRMDMTYRNIINKDYRIRVDEEFKPMTITNVGGHEAAAVRSTAEMHALYLSFIAVLSSLSQEMQKSLGSVGQKPTEQFPIVMDAGLGNFDDEPARRLLDALSGLSHQVVLLVSKRQGHGAAEEAVREVCGKKSILVLNTTKTNANPELIEIGGHKYDYVIRSDSFDFTEIKEI